jgi:ribose transport system substrate-binding protein
MSEEDKRHRPLRPISGLGPHGEFATTVDELRISSKAAERAASARFSVALVLHTMSNDWARLQIRGIRDVLQRYGAELTRVVEGSFRRERQAEILDDVLSMEPDAVISVPVGVEWVADALRRVGKAHVKLVLMDNVPAGMVAERDYASVISCDNFGNGEVAAEVLRPFVPLGGRALIVGYNVDFYVTNERELGFRRWMRENRPDVSIERLHFSQPEEAGTVVHRFLSQGGQADAIFVVWDEPALLVMDAIKAAGMNIPITTVDLGTAVAFEIARGGLIKGVGATLAYDQGVAEATATIMALTGDEPPPTWVALPAQPITRETMIAGYEAVWHEPTPRELVEALRSSEPK